MQSEEHYAKSSLLTLPFEIFVRILGDVDMISLIKLSWVSPSRIILARLIKLLAIIQTCKEFNAFVTTERYLWQLVVRKQLYDELIPVGSLPLSEMSLPQLFSYATRKSRLFDSMRRNYDGVNCRRIDIHLTLPDTPEYFEFSMKYLLSPKLLPGGRYILGLIVGDSTSLICCWDLYIPPIQHGTMLPAATLLLPRAKKLLLSRVLCAPGRSLQDRTFPFAVFKATGDHSEIAILQLRTSPVAPPTLNISASRKWNHYVTPTSIVGDWVIIQGLTEGGESGFVWNWKSNYVEQLSSSPGCVLLTAWGVLALTGTSGPHEQQEERGLDASDEMLGLTIAQFRSHTRYPASGVASLAQGDFAENLLSTQQVSQSASVSAVSSIYSTTGSKATSGRIAEPVLHSAEEAIFFIKDVKSTHEAWEQRMFSIRTPFEVSCSYATGTSRVSVDIIERHTGLCEWSSPHGLNFDSSDDSESALAQQFKRDAHL
ncbi:hypothetical protein DL93DRAFT_2172951 [Clavulina sp. PMI_390]|nr:hypothetical protein DL93DRAFT_2172951 [Clavulina sp. PMI_390]